MEEVKKMTAKEKRTTLLGETGGLIEKVLVASARRQLGIYRRVDPEAVTKALIFARVSNETGRFSASWLHVLGQIKDQDPNSLPAELRVALAMLPKDRDEAEVFDGALGALKPWVDHRLLDFEPVLPPDFLDLFANPKERQRWERLQKEESLTTDWSPSR